jgi:crossover junction endodeoxyribonuclease RusA
VRQVKFTAYVTPIPQGSMKGFVVPGKWGAKDRAILTSDNTKLKPYRGEVTREAMVALGKAGIAEPFADKHVPVSVIFDFYLQKPVSTPKKRQYPSVKPDLSKLVRSTEDAMTGILYADDAQVVEFSVRKHYGTPERVEVTATIIDEDFVSREPQLTKHLTPSLF